MPDKNGVQLRVVTNAYSGNVDERFAEQLKEISRREKPSGLALVMKKEMPAVMKAASELGIPALRFSSPAEFCEGYDAKMRKSSESYVLCFTSSLTASGEVLERIGDRARTQLDTHYWKN